MAPQWQPTLDTRVQGHFGVHEPPLAARLAPLTNLLALKEVRSQSVIYISFITVLQTLQNDLMES